jgi:hypothetical protein
VNAVLDQLADAGSQRDGRPDDEQCPRKHHRSEYEGEPATKQDVVISARADAPRIVARRATGPRYSPMPAAALSSSIRVASRT